MTRQELAAELITAYNEGEYLLLACVGEQSTRAITDPFFAEELLETAAELLTCQPI